MEINVSQGIEDFDVGQPSQHLIGLLGCFEDRKAVYLVLELSRGGDLHKYLRRHKGLLEESEAKEIIVQILSTVAFLHRHQVLHRDIKLSNLLLEDSHARPLRVKLSDFGLAVAVGEDGEEEKRGFEGREGGTSVTMRHTYGTPDYMAPEVLFDGARHGPASDVWSAGCLFYTLLVGRGPFRSSSSLPF
ncbi:serine threonine-protein kinase plk4 [Nannochloropsis gaditana]|uniref:Serine threonine-protein kinase plk4 n=1 Tax=Nannochloropsis gaditana TaxID=72520 RepID=W7TNZ5_9STRA|nr:serine threonine-protein kinase plk4 [Nannochloropsis gaditana]